MTYSIIYSSQTGNTAILAKRLASLLPDNDLLYFGPPDAAAQKADLLFVGFWTDKGSSDQAASDFLKTLRHKQIFLFGTAGFGGSESYFARILSGVRANIESSNTIAASYMCQGKMPLSVRKRYESMQSEQPEKMQALIENFDNALSHPNEADLAQLTQLAAKYI